MLLALPIVLLGRPSALAFVLLAGCGGRASGALATTPDAGPDAPFEGGSAVDVITRTEASLCANAQDCPPPSEDSNSVYCCTDNACLPNQPGYCTDANEQLVLASSYDQSCKTDADCLAVAEGNGCNVGAFDCPNAAINRGAYAQYQSDIAKTHAASCNIGIFSGCVGTSDPCCQNGSCVQCSSALAQAGDAGEPSTD